jgi:hypothetical protein
MLRTRLPKAAAARAQQAGVAGRVLSTRGCRILEAPEGVTRLMRLAVGAARNAWWRKQQQRGAGDAVSCGAAGDALAVRPVVSRWVWW